MWIFRNLYGYTVLNKYCSIDIEQIPLFEIKLTQIIYFN